MIKPLNYCKFQQFVFVCMMTFFTYKSQCVGVIIVNYSHRYDNSYVTHKSGGVTNRGVTVRHYFDIS